MPRINFTPSVKQDKAWKYLTDNVTSFIGYGGAAFGGKSYLLCYWLTIMCYAYPETTWGLGRRELVTLKRTTLLTLFKVFKECGIEPVKDYDYNQQLNVITFNNGSKIFLIDTAYKPSDPLYTRFGGYELTSCAIDESAETSLEAIDILYTRCGRKNNKKYGLLAKMLETFNPVKNHVYKRYYQPFKSGKLQESYQFVPALPRDNPSPEAHDYIEGILKNANKITVQRLIYGNFEYDDDPSSIIEYDKIVDLWSNNHIKEAQLKSKERVEMSMTVDVARLGKDNTVIYVYKGWILVARYVLGGKWKVDKTVTRVEEIATKHSVPNSRIVIDSDGVGGGVADYIHGSKDFVNNSKPIKEHSKAPRYANLKSQCYWKLAERINSNGLLILPNKPEFIERLTEELEQVKNKYHDDELKPLTVTSKKEVALIIGRSPDDSDSLMMLELLDLKKTGSGVYGSF